MYTLPLPPRPDIEQYRKLAKDFQAACKSSEPDAMRRRVLRWAEDLARLSNMPEQPDRVADRLAARWQQFRGKNERAADCLLADAQLFVARSHGFASWPKFAAHLKDLVRDDSPVSQFEQAVEAIVAGDRDKLAAMLRENPALAKARSARGHGSTLLHYVSANGVEDYRQKTPANIVAIAELLLRAGADVNAESDAYGGHDTALSLTATSCHPEDAGVQIPLMELLIAHGAKFDGPNGSGTVNDCLRNGRGMAAEILASRGARLDLEGAAGVGRIDLVERFFDAATPQQKTYGLCWACEFGRTAVVEFLLRNGVAVDTKLQHGETGLHWAAYGAHPDIVRLLIERGAPLDETESRFGGTPLDWALHAWNSAPRDGFYEVVAMLIRAGAKTRAYEGDDPAMRAALAGKRP